MTTQRKSENYKDMRTYKYIVNESKRTVVCLIYTKDEPFVNDYYKDFRVFRGIAKCNENDEFNVEFGKELAKKRALMDLTDLELRVIDLEYSDEIVNNIQQLYVKMVNALDRKEYLKTQIASLKNEIFERVCPF